MKKDNKIFVVLGMHRSGTSLVAGILHNCGVKMGSEKTFIPKPNKENPKGFFENYDFRKINDKVLERSGYIVKKWNTHLEEIKPGWFQKKAIERLIKKSEREGINWGWKDPRQMLTMDIWITILEEKKLLQKCRFIFVFRNPISVAKSMIKRGNFKDLAQGEKIWNLYNKTCLDSLEKNQIHFLVVSFEDLIFNPDKTLNKIESFGDIKIADFVRKDFISPNMNRSQVAKEDNYEMEKETAELFNKLKSLKSI